MQVGGAALHAPLTPHVRVGGPDNVNPALQEYLTTESHWYLAATWRAICCGFSSSSSSSSPASSSSLASSKAATLPPVLWPFNRGPGSGHVTAVRWTRYGVSEKYYNFFFAEVFKITFITARKRSLGHGDIFAPVCHSVHREGEVPGQVPPGRYTPLAGTPLWQVHPQQVHPLWAGTPPWAGTPLPGTPPWQVHPPGRYTTLGRYTSQSGTPQGRYPRAGTPPGSSACWEIRATSGRYESYWNAFLFYRNDWIKYPLFY